MSRQIDPWRAIIETCLGRLAYLSPEEDQRLQRAYEAIEDIQRRCYHNFKEDIVFTTSGKFCTYCGKPEPV